MGKYPKLKGGFREDLFFNAGSNERFNNKTLKVTTRYAEIKWRAPIMEIRNDWLTSWQMKNE